MPFPRWLLLLPIALFGLWLRLGDLDRRPMHADEANQAVKLGELLEQGGYQFDPKDHHGPTLYYAALPFAWIRGQTRLAALDETTLRLVPVIFGTAAVLLLGLVATPLGRWTAIAAAAFLAVSPPAVYYSRYFIQETLLLTFALGAAACALEWWRAHKLGWALGAGACVGLMQATKATAPLFVVAAVIAWAGARTVARDQSPEDDQDGVKRALLGAIAAALLTGTLLYSSFLTNPAGLRDALTTYAHALTRFGSHAPPTGHEKPWWYYVHLFGWFHQGGLLWQQLAFSALALGGCVVACCKRERFLLGVAIYTAVIVAAFSLFAYKTPWQAIHFVPGFALLAATALAAIARLRTGKFVAVPLALLVTASLFQQTRLSSYRYPAQERNPYAYVHSSSDVFKYRPLVEAALARSTTQPVRVVSEEYWPLPWYLRGLPRVGYWSEPPADCDGALVIVSSTQADAVRARLRGKYRESILGLRPGFLCIVFTPLEGGNEGLRD